MGNCNRPDNYALAFAIAIALTMLLIRHLRQLITCAGPAPRRGAAQRDVADHRRRRGRVGRRSASSSPDRTRGLAAVTRARAGRASIDGRALSVVPGFVDAHTHAMFAGDRRDELRRRLAGATYAEIAAAGGGIVSTVRATRAASEDELVGRHARPARRDARVRDDDRARSRAATGSTSRPS